MPKIYSWRGRPGNPFALSRLLIKQTRYSMAITSSSSKGKCTSGNFQLLLIRPELSELPSLLGNLLGDEDDLKISQTRGYQQINNCCIVYFCSRMTHKRFCVNQTFDIYEYYEIIIGNLFGLWIALKRQFFSWLWSKGMFRKWRSSLTSEKKCEIA